MFKVLSLAAALVVLPLAPALAQETPKEDASEAALEAAEARFEARMDEFSDRAEVISDDKSLTEDQQKQRITAIWAEYAPDLQAFTAVVSRHASLAAGQALAEVDVEAVVANALTEANLSGVLRAAGGMAANGAWASNDPEHAATMGLVVDYAVGEGLDAAGVGDEAPAPQPAPAPQN